MKSSRLSTQLLFYVILHFPRILGCNIKNCIGENGYNKVMKGGITSLKSNELTFLHKRNTQ